MKTLNTILFTSALLFVNPLNANSQDFNTRLSSYKQDSYIDSLIQPSQKRDFNSKDLFMVNYKQQYPSLDNLIQHFRVKGFEIEGFFSNSKFEIYENIDKSFKNSAEKVKNYEIYKEKLGVEIKKGKIKKFMANYDNSLNLAEKEYNIPKEIISAIIGVESDFGKNIGKYYAFNSFVSLFIKDYKTNFALEQLGHLLKFSEKNNIDIFELKSSYAGAIGFGQFIPSSLNQFFIGNDVYDMNSNILSVANYLSCTNERRRDINQAIWDYNHNDFYVKAVLELAESGK